jgi:hypothetical protein
MSESGCPSGKAFSSRCEMLDPALKKDGAYILGSRPQLTKLFPNNPLIVIRVDRTWASETNQQCDDKRKQESSPSCHSDPLGGK